MSDDYKTIPAFDRAIGNLDGRPDVTKTKPATVRATDLLGSATFIVQTYRERQIKPGPDGEETARGRDTIFVEFISAEGHLRIALPPGVADTIARQRDALTTTTRKATARKSAQARKDAGLVPTFKRQA